MKTVDLKSQSFNEKKFNIINISKKYIISIQVFKNPIIMPQYVLFAITRARRIRVIFFLFFCY